MDAIDRIAERRIREAMEAGAFDDLPGRGKPLVIDDDLGVPEELRLVYRILKNAGVLPEELELRKEMATLSALLAACADDDGRRRLVRLRSARELRYRQLMERRGAGSSAAALAYRERVEAKLLP